MNILTNSKTWFQKKSANLYIIYIIYIQIQIETPFLSLPANKARIGQIQGRKFGTQAIAEFHGRQGIHASELAGFGGVGGVTQPYDQDKMGRDRHLGVSPKK